MSKSNKKIGLYKDVTKMTDREAQSYYYDLIERVQSLQKQFSNQFKRVEKKHKIRIPEIKQHLKNLTLRGYMDYDINKIADLRKKIIKAQKFQGSMAYGAKGYKNLMELRIRVFGGEIVKTASGYKAKFGRSYYNIGLTKKGNESSLTKLLNVYHELYLDNEEDFDPSDVEFMSQLINNFVGSNLSQLSISQIKKKILEDYNTYQDNKIRQWNNKNRESEEGIEIDNLWF